MILKIIEILRIDAIFIFEMRSERKKKEDKKFLWWIIAKKSFLNFT